MRTPNHQYPRPSSDHPTSLRAILRLINRDAFPSSVQALTSGLSSWEAWRLLRRLDRSTAAALLPHFKAGTHRMLATNADPDWLAAVLAQCPATDRAAILQALSPEQRRLLQAANPSPADSMPQQASQGVA